MCVFFIFSVSLSFISSFFSRIIIDLTRKHHFLAIRLSFLLLLSFDRAWVICDVQSIEIYTVMIFVVDYHADKSKWATTADSSTIDENIVLIYCRRRSTTLVFFTILRVHSEPSTFKYKCLGYWKKKKKELFYHVDVFDDRQNPWKFFFFFLHQFLLIRSRKFSIW